MGQQLCFDGFEATRIDPVFFAVQPDAPARRRIGETGRRLAAERGLRGRPLAPDRLHVTLQSVTMPREKAADFLPVAETIVSRLALYARRAAPPS